MSLKISEPLLNVTDGSILVDPLDVIKLVFNDPGFAHCDANAATPAKFVDRTVLDISENQMRQYDSSGETYVQSEININVHGNVKTPKLTVTTDNINTAILEVDANKNTAFRLNGTTYLKTRGKDGGAVVDSVTIGSGGLWNFQVPAQIEGVRVATVDDLGGFKSKITYDNSTVQTVSTGQGIQYEFLGAGSSSATHDHEFDDSGVIWISNFQTSFRGKIVNVGTSVGNVSFSSYTIPFNMIARFSYAKATNKMNVECSYVLPELIDYAKEGYVTESIETNNDQIITPDGAEVFQFTDDTKTDGYGTDGGTHQTYFAPTDGLQSSMLLNNLDYSSVFGIHNKIKTKTLFLMIHESYAAQIYDRDLAGVNELTMLFGPNSRGRLTQYNQTSPVGSIWNWNGQAIPAANDPNELEPTIWIKRDGSETTEWGTPDSVVATCCYSSGTLANDGSAALRRGDVRYSAATKIATFEADNASPFYVMPIRCGAGTFNDVKVFAFFMSRESEVENEWDSYIFEDSAACVGTLLKISYDAAMEYEESKEKEEEVAQLRAFNLAVNSQNEYGTQLSVDLRG